MPQPKVVTTTVPARWFANARTHDRELQTTCKMVPRMPHKVCNYTVCRNGFGRKPSKTCTTPFARWFRNGVPKFAPTRSAKWFQMPYARLSATHRVPSRMLPRNDPRWLSVAKFGEPYTRDSLRPTSGLPSSFPVTVCCPAPSLLAQLPSLRGCDSCGAAFRLVGCRMQPACVAMQLQPADATARCAAPCCAPRQVVPRRSCSTSCSGRPAASRLLRRAPACGC